MTTFSKIIVVCPHCKCLMQDYELMSYTVFESIFYSDGAQAPTSISFSEKKIGICFNCRQPFWKEDAISQDDPYKEEFENLPSVTDVFDIVSAENENFFQDLPVYYSRLINENFANTIERRIFLRMQLWWSINDLIRSKASFKDLLKINWRSLSDWKRLISTYKQSVLEFKKFKTLFIRNLQKLAEIIENEKQPDYLQLAEIYREMGKFGKALNNLNKVEDKNNRAYKQIRNKTLLVRKRVFQLK